MKDLLHDARLFGKHFRRIRVICIDDESGILQAALCVCLAQIAQILIVIIRMHFAVAVDVAAQNRVREHISLRVYLPPAV